MDVDLIERLREELQDLGVSSVEIERQLGRAIQDFNREPTEAEKVAAIMNRREIS